MHNHFNDEQNLALATPYNKNVAISAGAGSGKTRTLTEKVSLLLSSKDIKPSELLVLTFTSNAAHEMKSRIIKRLKNNEELKDKILSSHIQTFDSFSQYIVSKYSYILGIPDNISIASSDVLNAKISSTLDEILGEYYSSTSSFKKILMTLKKISLHDDRQFKMIILDLYSRLDKLLPKQKEEFILKNKTTFFSKEHFDELLDEYTSFYKNKIIERIFNAYFTYKYSDSAEDILKAYELFSSKGFGNIFNLNIDQFDFNDDINNEIYHYLLKLLSLEAKDFILEIKKVFKSKEDSDEYNYILKPKFKDPLQKTIYNENFKSIFNNADALLLPINNLGNISLENNDFVINFDEDYVKYLSFKDDVSLLIDIVNELDKRIFNYQKQTNCYSYQSISRLAIKLLENEKVSNDIRETFKFIMIDEYQDTNDLQELFLSYLLKPRESDGGRASLFVVGDAKQAIYAFRNSNVELFKARLKDTNQIVIKMNKNYRSGSPLLREINYVFSYYMDLDNGGIKYQEDDEALLYDKNVNIYSEDYQHFGVERITSLSMKNYDGLAKKYQKDAWEALAIIKDIKSKVHNPNYLVSEKTDAGNILREATYHDFCILMRTKKGFDLYQKLFDEHGIKLNINYSSSLSEVDAIIVIQSLVDLIGYIIGVNPDADVRHLFMSLARSYIYQYDDQKLFDLLTDKGELDILNLDTIKADDLYLEVEEFAMSHIDKNFSTIFMDMINHFKIIEKLYLIGSVRDNINKIESLFSIITSEEEMGEGIKEFIILMKNISKYQLDLETDNQLDVEDAVDMMSIHASKGLERKIIYLPNSFNKYSGEPKGERPDYLYSLNNGIILPYYQVKIINNEIANNSIYTLPFLVENNKENHIEKDEHVRLFYVALTRAENTVIIVGDSKGRTKDRKEGNLYGMLSYLPSYPVLDKNLELVINKIISRETLDKFHQLVDLLKKGVTPLSKSSFINEFSFQKYRSYYLNVYQNSLYKEMDNLLEEISNKLFEHFYLSSLSSFDNLDSLSIIYASMIEKTKVSNFIELCECLLSYKNVDNDEEDEESESSLKPLFNSKEEIKSYLLDKFSTYLKDGNYTKLNISISKSELKRLSEIKINYKNVPLELKNELLPILIKMKVGSDYIYYWSYHIDNVYEDKISHFDYYSFNESKTEETIELGDMLVDNTPITFTPRVKSRASKYMEEIDLDLSKIFIRGTYLHRLLELVDLKSKDTSFITNEKDRLLISKVLELPLFDEVNKAIKVYKEYPYYDEKRLTNGFIDLFFINKKDNKDIYTIVDYKTRHTKNDGYVRQLNVYKENIKRLFNLDDSSEFRLLLLSIEDQQVFEVKGEEVDERN